MGKACALSILMSMYQLTSDLYNIFDSVCLESKKLLLREPIALKNRFGLAYSSLLAKSTFATGGSARSSGPISTISAVGPLPTLGFVGLAHFGIHGSIRKSA